MTDLLRTTLARRGTVAADTLLDCLALVVVLGARYPDSVRPIALTDRLITLKELRRARCCSNWEAIQRMDALQVAQLVDTTYHSGRNAWWEVHRVGPA
jgi:hypothetical protein